MGFQGVDRSNGVPVMKPASDLDLGGVSIPCSAAGV